MSCPICGQDHTTITCPNEWKLALYNNTNGTAVPPFTPFMQTTAWTLPASTFTWGTSPFKKVYQHKKNEYSHENLDKWR